MNIFKKVRSIWRLIRRLWQREIWESIEDYKELYKISNKGRVKSFHGRKVRILRPGLNNNGYRLVSLYKKGEKKTYKISILVYDHFGKNKRHGHKLQVDHISGIKTDDWIGNLQLLTNRENTSKGYIQNGGISSKYSGVGRHKLTKKWESYIRINGVKEHLGLFKDEFDAHLAYQGALKEINEER
jgi:hypothetical protein